MDLQMHCTVILISQSVASMSYKWHMCPLCLSMYLSFHIAIYIIYTLCNFSVHSFNLYPTPKPTACLVEYCMHTRHLVNLPFLSQPHFLPSWGFWNIRHSYLQSPWYQNWHNLCYTSTLGHWRMTTPREEQVAASWTTCQPFIAMANCLFQ